MLREEQPAVQGRTILLLSYSLVVVGQIVDIRVRLPAVVFRVRHGLVSPQGKGAVEAPITHTLSFPFPLQ